MSMCDDRASEYMRLKVIHLKEEIDISTIIIEDFTQLSVINRLVKQKIGNNRA